MSAQGKDLKSLCGAGVAHSLGKGEATGSNPVKGKFIEN